MSGSIPTSTSVVESAVIDAPLAAVWHLIKLKDVSSGRFRHRTLRRAWTRRPISKGDDRRSMACLLFYEITR